VKHHLEYGGPSGPMERAHTDVMRHRGRRRAPVSEFVKAALEGDVLMASAVAVDFMREKGSRATVIADLFDGAQKWIGDMWHVGQATSADEYRVASAIAAAVRALPNPPSERATSGRGRILVATLAGERHHLGLVLASVAFADDGWEVHTAMEVERNELVRRAVSTGAAVVGISVTYPTHFMRMELPAVVRALQSAGLRVLLGGAAFVRQPALADAAGADALAPDARTGLIIARRLLGGRRLWHTLREGEPEVGERAS
jgi:methylmalonyl-CoA mutase cobalamin-binding domain/chain